MKSINLKFEINIPEIGHKKMLLNARRIYRGDIGTELILLTMDNVTIKPQTEI